MKKIKKGLWFDKNNEIAIKDGIAQRDLLVNEELFWHGERYVVVDFKTKKPQKEKVNV